MTRPLAISRHAEIMRRLRREGAVSVSELAQHFGVSHETVRRDLKQLADQGHLDVVHGGAAHRGAAEPHLSARSDENPQGKAAIARAAVSLVREGGSVLLDSGTTTGALARELAAREHITVFTNSLAHATVLCRSPSIRVVVLGGEVDPNDEATFGLGPSIGLDNIRADIVFIGSGGFSPDGDLTDYSPLAAEFRGRLIGRGQAYVLADHSKFARRTPFRVPHFDDVAGVIVDRAPTGTLAEAWTRRKIRTVIAG